MEGTRKRQMPSEIHIRRAHNGFVVRHSYDNSMNGMSYQPSTEHAFTSRRTMMGHLREHLGGDDGDELTPHPAVVPRGVGRRATVKPPSRRSFGAGVD